MSEKSVIFLSPDHYQYCKDNNIFKIEIEEGSIRTTKIKSEAQILLEQRLLKKGMLKNPELAEMKFNVIK